MTLRNHKIIISLLILLLLPALSAWARKEVIPPSYAWIATAPLGQRHEATIDTLLPGYYLTAVPSAISPAYATTGNLGGAGMNMIYHERKPMGDFFFKDALRPWIPDADSHKFYNTRIPMTLLSYSTGGSKETAQDRLKVDFSGNAGPKLQIGAMLDYIYSKGSYNYQANKGLIWGLAASYIGDRYELQAFYNHFNVVNKENGGITNDLYITDPAELQGGVSTIDSKSIPTNLSASHNRVRGSQLFVNNRYKVGFWKEERDENDSVINRTYIPVSSFIWTIQYNNGRHRFINTNAKEDREFWENQYMGTSGTNDHNSYSKLSNTIGISLLEGFNKWAKAGLAIYLRHDLLHFRQTADTVAISAADGRPDNLTPWPYDFRIAPKATENYLHAGGRLTKQQGKLLTYDAGAEFGLIGRAVGDFSIDGNISTRFRLLGDTVTITGYGLLRNKAAPYLTTNYISNHFVWHNDFGKTRTFSAGGILDIPHTRTGIRAGVENVQNQIYFDAAGLPVQHGGSVQVFSVNLRQNFKVGILHWDNNATFQTSTNQEVIPLPKFAIYSNLYLYFKIARVLQVQFGVDCDYYTSYYAPSFQPATMTFTNQREIKCGNYPFMNAYLNMKLSKARFFVLFSHVNQGLFGGNNYFSMPHYPLNPRRFQIGVSVDFAN